MMFEPGSASDLIFRLGAATLIGGALGLDRERHRKPAGLRTHALVALGAALTTAVTLAVTSNGGNINGDAVSRAIQGIIAGVGFLGGGAILKTPARDAGVLGLTTAASIWVVAALGIACGAGYWPAALIGLSFGVVVLVIGAPLDRLIQRRFAGRRTSMTPDVADPDEDVTPLDEL